MMPRNDEGRPGGNRTARNVNYDTASVPVHPVIRVDLSEDTDATFTDRHHLDGITQAPKGCRIVVYVGDRTLLTQDAVAMLRYLARTHRVEVEGNAWAVRTWCQAVATGEVIPW